MKQTDNPGQFDHWIRTAFVEMNAELERLYFAQEDDRANVDKLGDNIKTRLTEEGRSLIMKLLREGNTDESFEATFDVLGNVGFYMAACRRHDITEPSREQSSPLKEASSLALHLGASLGVAPRFATAHLTTHNTAVSGVSKSFTGMPDEFVFNDYNTRSILCFKRVSDALFRVLAVGVSSPIAADLLMAAREALAEVIANNELLFSKLDTDRFFYSVRPYYKPYRVGQHIYRGANAGDFAGINVIDMLLGLCRADHSYYSQLLVDKLLYMVPDDQALLKDCMRRSSLLNDLLALPITDQSCDWYQHNTRLFLEVCDLHGQTAMQHHNQLVNKFIKRPSESMDERHLDKVTASGPPLPVLLRSLEKLRDLRTAAPRDDIPTSHDDLQTLRDTLLTAG
ncbi:MAG: hypothetical protein ACI9GW_003085 [Halieaceae bacterium]|jgi:hypothetical protein